MGQPVAFFEIISPDYQRATTFYGELFGWQIATSPEMGEYALVDTGGGESAVTGGIGPAQGPDDAGVKIYLRVDDLDAYLGRAETLGGRRVLEPMDLPGGFGRIAVLADPDGNPVGLWA